MREELLGLALDEALRLMQGQGLSPRVTLTAAPRRAGSQEGVLRVVYASEGGELTAARFLEPTTDGES